jgi:hypothetical protein
MIIDILKHALELAREGVEIHNENSPEYKVCAALIATLEAKDEPVAWRDAAIRLGEELSSVGPDGYYDMDAKKWLDWAMKQNPRGEHSLPQRTWVGLTETECGFLFKVGMTPFDYYQAIEAKLKEKNG